MYRIDSNGNVGSLPTPAALGTEGFWSAGDPTEPRNATELDQDWFNCFQESLIAFLTWASVTHSKSDYSKLLQSMLALPALIDVGSVNALAVTPPVALPAPASIADGTTIEIIVANTNTGPSMLVASGGAATTITYPDGSALPAGTLRQGWVARLRKTGGASPVWWLLQSVAPSRLAHGEAILTRTDNTHLTLMPRNGANMLIGGIQYQLPAAGVTALSTSTFVNGTAAQPLVASTHYYAYLFNNAGTLALDFRSDGHMVDTTAGNIGTEVRSNSGAADSSRSYVGHVYLDASGHFQDSITQRFVQSWFNRQKKGGYISHGGDSTSSSTPVEFNSSFRIEFICEATDTVMAQASAQMSASGTPALAFVQVGLDGTTVFQASSATVAASSVAAASNLGTLHDLAAGYHYLAGLGSVSGGAATISYTWNIGIELMG